jgi:hypothetical protein
MRLPLTAHRAAKAAVHGEIDRLYPSNALAAIGAGQ